jgi:hypothetical protein
MLTLWTLVYRQRGINDHLAPRGGFAYAGQTDRRRGVTPHFFGYGSLVNRRTHDYPDARPASVRGFRRAWRHTRLREVAYLTVREAPGHEIDGLIASVPGGNWTALDLREAAYQRRLLAATDVRHDHPEAISVEIYQTRAADEAAPSVRYPVLLSYVDTVVAGFHDVFGAEGAARFFATTDGWDIPVVDDRAAPIYARAVAPDGEVRRQVDTALDAFGVVRLDPARFAGFRTAGR